MANGIVEITRAGKVLRVDEHKARMLVARGEAVLGNHPASLVESDEKCDETEAESPKKSVKRRRSQEVRGDEWPN
jgi:hypothetical protein